jgi:hypothetical protein
LLLGLCDSAGRLDHVGFTSTIRDAERPTLDAEARKVAWRTGVDRQGTGRPESMELRAQRKMGFGLNWWWKFDLITLPAIAFATAPS